jgi:hypothetical protein
MRVFLACLIVVAIVGMAGKCKAHDPSHADAAWYNSQKLTPETKSRFGVQYTSCCDKGDHFDTRFRVADDGSRYGAETYEYLTREGTWKRVHPDIIQRKKTPDGRPVLFILSDGRESCLIVDEEGI